MRWLAALSLLAALPVHAALLEASDVADLSLEELANIRITSVSKKSESIANVAASIFVITGEDIRRSGAASLPEALRLAPNLQVARIDARNYAITARGFNNTFANKLQVLIDGRTIYTPLFAGVFWDAPDVVLEDIERIEVISGGAGGTMWGANAVNGVINVITRSAKDTQGGLLAAGSGSHQRSGTLRVGKALDNGGHYRAYGKYSDDDHTHTAGGGDSRSGWNRTQTGFRMDMGNGSDGVTIQGDAYNARLEEPTTRDIRLAGANLLGRINKQLADGSDLRLQAYWDYTERNQPANFDDRLNTLDLEFQHAKTLAKVHSVMWGAGYRYAWDRIENRSVVFLPESKDMYWGNIFAQDKIALRDDLDLTLGLKAEKNHYTGVEYLPTVRLAWQAAANHAIWGSASRAVRTPSRFDRDLFPFQSPDFVSEVAKVYELGYRAQPTPTVSVSATVFYSVYDRLRNLGADLKFGNAVEGTVQGIEMWGSWQALPAWRLSGGIVAQKSRLDVEPGNIDLAPMVGLAGNDPSSYWMLRSSYDISQTQQLDATLRHVGGLQSPETASYYSMDLRYGWKIRPDVELSLTGQNLLDSPHAEYGSGPTSRVFDRSVYLEMLWRF